MTKKNQIIFMKGKELALKHLFGTEVPSPFGYLAIGHSTTEVNGFVDPLATNNSTLSADELGPYNNGFMELPEGNNYHRIPLNLRTNDITYDQDTGKVLVKFEATLSEDNIISSEVINQLAIVDDASVQSANTNFYSATVFPDFTKSDQSSITFVIGFRL